MRTTYIFQLTLFVKYIRHIWCFLFSQSWLILVNFCRPVFYWQPVFRFFSHCQGKNVNYDHKASYFNHISNNFIEVMIVKCIFNQYHKSTKCKMKSCWLLKRLPKWNKCFNLKSTLVQIIETFLLYVWDLLAIIDTILIPLGLV